MQNELELAREALLEIVTLIAFKEIDLPEKARDKLDTWMAVYKKEQYTLKGENTCQQEKGMITEK